MNEVKIRSHLCIVQILIIVSIMERSFGQAKSNPIIRFVSRRLNEEIKRLREDDILKL